MNKRLLLIVVSTLMCGCTVVYKMPDPIPPTSQPQVSNSPQTAVSSPVPMQSPNTEQKPLTISLTIQICQEIQKAANIPIGCEVKYLEGIPTMYIAFPNYTIASNSWQIITEGLAAPFCMSANSANRQANLVLAVQDTKLARVYSCETNVWTDWVNYGNSKY